MQVLEAHDPIVWGGPTGSLDMRVPPSADSRGARVASSIVTVLLVARPCSEQLLNSRVRIRWCRSLVTTIRRCKDLCRGVKVTTSVPDRPTIDWPGYDIIAAPVDSWRTYDVSDPDPGYFQFDWMSSRHPDLYHSFALTSDGLVAELDQLVDLRGLEVVDVGAGTGRSTAGLARKAAHVLAVDVYASVVAFGQERLRAAALGNVTYKRADRSHLPVPDASVDVVVGCWAELDRVEAARTLRPGGLLVQMGGHPEEPGELGPILAAEFPHLVPGARGGAEPRPDRAAADLTLPAEEWPDVNLADGVLHAHDFTYTAQYGSPEEAAAIFGRLFGPRSARYLWDRGQSTVWSRLRICYGYIVK